VATCNSLIDSKLALSVKARFSHRDIDPRKRTVVPISSSDYIDWNGASGKTYRYWFLKTPRVASSIKDEGGNYALVQQLPNGNFVPLYFGIADSLRNRIPNHERWPDAIRASVTHAMSHTTPAGELAQDAEERDLIQQWNPPLNVHHRTVG
jgi:hypothetical protein